MKKEACVVCSQPTKRLCKEEDCGDFVCESLSCLITHEDKVAERKDPLAPVKKFLIGAVERAERRSSSHALALLLEELKK